MPLRHLGPLGRVLAEPRLSSAVLLAAAERGQPLGRDIAEAIAEGAALWAEDWAEVWMQVTREAWEIPHLRDSVRQRLARELSATVLAARQVPVTLPAERIFRSSWRYDPAATAPPPPEGEGMPEGSDWDFAWVITGCGVRTPPDRAEAVRAAVAARRQAADQRPPTGAAG